VDNPQWTKCFSKTRQKEYFFNSITGQSVWTLEELNRLNKSKHQNESKLLSKDKDLPPPKQTKLKLKAKEKIAAHNKVSNASPLSFTKRSKQLDSGIVTKSAKSTKTKNDEIDEIPMEIDEIIENVIKIRKDTSSNETSRIKDSNLTELIELKNEIKTNRIAIVLDTNIFLSHLKSIKNLYADKKLENILFVVPWVVVQELDNCKNKKEYSQNINKQAQESIKFIMSVLQAKSSSFHFENASQVYFYFLIHYRLYLIYSKAKVLLNSKFFPSIINIFRVNFFQ
jgi:hypothetical protein